MTERLSAPWRIVETPGGLAIHDASGLPLCYLYFEDDRTRRSAYQENILSSEEARRIADAIVNLPDPRKASCAASPGLRASGEEP